MGAVHALGTGRILVYGQGPEWMQIIGAPYSCPAMASLRFSDAEEICAVSERSSGASDWVHTLSKKPPMRSTRIDCGVFHDIAVRDWHCILRRWQLDVPLTLHLTGDYPIEEITALMGDGVCDAAFAITVPRTAPVYNDYPVGTPSTMAIGIRCDGGCCTAVRMPGGIALTLDGCGTMYLCGGEQFPIAHAALSRVLPLDPSVLLAQQRTADAAYLAECEKNRAAKGSIPMSFTEAVSAAIEDVLFSIRAQQSEQGGVMAGHAYHLAYVRDQYGVLRGLLSMGDYASARAILQYYLDIEQKYGIIHNAQGMGDTGIFHIHENDNTEITAYLVLGCIDYLKTTADYLFFAKCLGLCGRAMQRSIPELAGGMMPFNGDETYIAGGLLPRSVIEQGSLEATALFLAAAEQLEQVCAEYGFQTDMLPADLHDCRIAAELSFDDNFARRGGYTVNCPKREELHPQPLYRHGVCYFGDSFGWLRAVDRGCYVCPACAGKPVQPDDTEYRLHSAYLTLPYVGCSVIGKPIIAGAVRSMLTTYRKTGRLPTVPRGNRIVGYDFGFLLYAAAYTGEDASDLLSAALAARDECGMWSEYYTLSGGHALPSGTRCRPWESAVNMDGILSCLTHKNEQL